MHGLHALDLRTTTSLTPSPSPSPDHYSPSRSLPLRPADRLCESLSVSLHFSSIAMALDEEFLQAAKDAKALTSTPSNDDMLILYGLYKVATVGKPDTGRPGLFDSKGKAKWDAWKSVEDKSPEDAKKDYILKVQQLQEA